MPILPEQAKADSDRLAQQSRGRDGLSFLRAVVAGELPEPPLGAALGMRFAEAEPGRVVFELTPSQLHYNPAGTVHGGVYSILLDSAAGSAVQSLLPAGVAHTSLDLTVKFLRPVTAATGRTGPLRAIGTVTHLGRRTALAEARLLDAEGRLCATAISSVMILRPEPGGAERSGREPGQ